MPIGTAQVVEVTGKGVFEQDIRYANGSWQSGGWGRPAQTGLALAVTGAGITGMSNGASTVVEISVN